VYSVYAAFASPTQREAMRKAFADGIAEGEVKQALFELVNAELAGPRERYEALMSDPARVERELQQGAERAHDLSRLLMDRLREAVGIRCLG